VAGDRPVALPAVAVLMLLGDLNLVAFVVAVQRSGC
jgi:hypothetical protein